MMIEALLKSGREPDVALGPLALWIHGRESPERSDYWDGNWLRATARCATHGTSVVIDGTFVHAGQLQSWLAELERVHHSLEGTAELAPIEPELRVTLTSGAAGRMEAVVEITPDHLNQEHTFRFELDQSYLPGLMSSLRRLLRQYPVVGADRS